MLQPLIVQQGTGLGGIKHAAEVVQVSLQLPQHLDQGGQGGVRLEDTSRHCLGAVMTSATLGMEKITKLALEQRSYAVATIDSYVQHAGTSL